MRKSENWNQRSESLERFVGTFLALATTQSTDSITKKSPKSSESKTFEYLRTITPKIQPIWQLKRRHLPSTAFRKRQWWQGIGESQSLHLPAQLHLQASTPQQNLARDEPKTWPKRQSKRLQRWFRRNLYKPSKHALSSLSWSNALVKNGTQQKLPPRKPQTSLTALSSNVLKKIQSKSCPADYALKPMISINADSCASPSSIQKNLRQRTGWCKDLTPPNGFKQWKKSLTHYMWTTLGSQSQMVGWDRATNLWEKLVYKVKGDVVGNMARFKARVVQGYLRQSASTSNKPTEPL